jgi:WD40 repeat protein
VYSAVFSLDGKRIVTASVDKTARLWDAATGKPIGLALTGHEDWVNSAAFSPDGNRIVTASGDWTARLWDAETGKPIGAPLEGHSNSVTNATFSPDGKRILTGSGDRTARLWDAETGKPIGAPINVPGGAVASAAFSPDGRRIVTASGRNSGWEREIGQAQVWDAETGKPVAAPLTGHDSRVSSATFSPDGTRIVTASWDKTAIVREIFASTQELAAQARASVPRCLTREQRVTAFLDPEPPAWCIDLEKWPYQTEGWKDWLKFKRANASPPRPDTAEWWPWVSAREAK